ncbi:MAG: hypothetical protein WDN72_00595 [Alphaproteobacteria bacterium]
MGHPSASASASQYRRVSLLRHAKAEADSTDGSDESRRLRRARGRRGRAQDRRVAEGKPHAARARHLLDVAAHPARRWPPSSSTRR